MADITNELMYEILKQLQAGQGRLEAVLNDVAQQVMRVRKDINDLRSDDLRLEVMQGQMDNRLQRIETRLNLTDA